MDANTFLMGGGGAPTAKFPTPGTTIGGPIAEPPQLEQQRDIKTGEKKFWGDGDPMMQLVVTVATDQRDHAIEDDDGKRRIFVKGQMKAAVADAVREAGAKGLEVGGTLWVRYTHDGQAQQGMSPPKQYQAKYITAASNALGLAPAPVQHQAPPPTPAAMPGAVPPGVNPVTGEISTPPPAGLTPQQYAAAQNNPTTAPLLSQIPPQQTPQNEPPF
ncbi:hypothetical protein PV735_11215 [Streptomyces turgidiscabies]|uniref:Uncharacterized protein n=1 Tax=Streptomyces turgidiscabies (strain Car8) TaxID=698760 RepID=L7EVT6_STRT8|nr:hypothetical protein [Streptomyces turgidiscabies]ELP62821.1 hypothetical protein STRTUCAR8_06421 [Streptomyces turgidiscabies Car8]MDX3493253.1 hypothetical protein [Streptomyces turgidiscabies]GAQ70553.1 hypothetical protein T45_02289 [Streptomyces turgidiscabies]